MVEFAERLSGASREVADVPAVLFTDGALLTANFASGLQKLLDVASKWGDDRQMKWNVNAEKSEVLESGEAKKSDIRAAWKSPSGKLPKSVPRSICKQQGNDR